MRNVLQTSTASESALRYAWRTVMGDHGKLGGLRLVLAPIGALGLAACAGTAPPSASVTPSGAAPTTSTVESIALPWVPHALDGEPGADAPKVAVDGDRVLLDGVLVADIRTIVEGDRLTRVDGLFDALKARRATWRGLHPGVDFPGVVTFAFDGGTKALIVKSVFQTAAFAGFPNGRFLVRMPEGIGSFGVDAQIPGWPPPAAVDSQVAQPGTRVNGRLPPEVIQREVRKNFGQFRLCYDAGLQRSANLRGIVRVKFVIGREGQVTAAENEASTIPDAEVVSCVVRAFAQVAFPKPEGGLLTVVYPINFAPGD